MLLWFSGMHSLILQMDSFSWSVCLGRTGRSHRSPALLSSQPPLGPCSVLPDPSLGHLLQMLLPLGARRHSSGGGGEWLPGSQWGILEMDPDLQLIPVAVAPRWWQGWHQDARYPQHYRDTSVLRSIRARMSGRAGYQTPPQCPHACEVHDVKQPHQLWPWRVQQRVLLSPAVNPEGCTLRSPGRFPCSWSQSEGTGQVPQQHVQRVLSTLAGLYFGDVF